MKQSIDHIWVGNCSAQKDFTFFLNNKVSHVINLCSSEIPNKWDHLRIKYLNYSFQDTDVQILFDDDNFMISEIADFIDQAR